MHQGGDLIVLWIGARIVEKADYSYTPYLLCYFFLFSYFFHVAAFFEKGRSGASAHWLDHQRFLSCRYTMPSHRGVVYRSFRNTENHGWGLEYLRCFRPFVGFYRPYAWNPLYYSSFYGRRFQCFCSLHNNLPIPCHSRANTRFCLCYYKYWGGNDSFYHYSSG